MKKFRLSKLASILIAAFFYMTPQLSNAQFQLNTVPPLNGGNGTQGILLA